MSPIYLDYNATTPVAPEVADASLPYLREHFGYPSSSHVYGERTRQAVVRARAEVAALIGAEPAEIVFTGCATEANNLAVLGVARALRARCRAPEPGCADDGRGDHACGRRLDRRLALAGRRPLSSRTKSWPRRAKTQP